MNLMYKRLLRKLKKIVKQESDAFTVDFTTCTARSVITGKTVDLSFARRFIISGMDELVRDKYIRRLPVCYTMEPKALLSGWYTAEAVIRFLTVSIVVPIVVSVVTTVATLWVNGLFG